MNRVKQFFQRQPDAEQSQKGQSIVLIALMMVAIIALVGIAIDVGFIFARGSQLQAAIDSAALAGVVELSGWTSAGSAEDIALENNALTKSAQFLNANNMPISVTTSLNNPNNYQVEATLLGATQYAVTATWPVETFFLKVLGFREPINLTRSATAAVFSLADIYASRRVEDGVLSTSNQAVFGPQICVNFGDPFSPWSSPFAPDSYTYQYRILVPDDYPEDILRVELFDPDSVNASKNDHEIFHSDIANPYFSNPSETKNCGPEPNGDGGSSNQKQPCLLRTGEKDLVTGSPFLDIDQVNPYWFVRIDENRGTGGAPGNGTCGEPSNYSVGYNTRTDFTLYYFRQNADGTVERIDLVTYYGQTGEASRDNGDPSTDMYWVSPGADMSFGYDYDPNPNGPDLQVTPLQIDSFEIDLTQDVPGIVRDQSTNARYIFLDVTTLSGSSENGFEIWAGPATYTSTVPSDVNLRNLHILNNPGSHSSKGATVFGLGNLPMNSNYADNNNDINPVNIPLLYVSPEMTGQTIEVTMFDSDSGAEPPVIFFFDTIAFTPADGTDLGYDPDKTDWAMAFGVNGVADPDGLGAGRCVPGSCAANGSISGANSGWVFPPYQITVPGELDNCDYSNPNMFDCTPFYGGILTARYTGGQNDTYGWQIRIEGLPYLVK
ncbi:MAG: hypothetical protein H6656_09715 [Ardenticatenaceae bacterium]|nr:hypothetical protein [Ardenticatenaceae bacterium]